MYYKIIIGSKTNIGKQGGAIIYQGTAFYIYFNFGLEIEKGRYIHFLDFEYRYQTHFTIFYYEEVEYEV